MREIKFRVWCGERLRSVNTLGWIDGELDFVHSPKYNGPVEDEVVIMQYTGLKDKNGREIYEGDILKGIGNQRTTVIFDEGCYGVSPLMRVSFHNDVKKPLFMVLRSVDIHEIEVIGNIYENSELLEGS